jgi:hypothetical protein
MIRVFFVCLVIAALLGSALHLGSTGTGVLLLVVVAVAVVNVLSGRTLLRCPYCRKRVKLGAAACHHCGRVVASTGGAAVTATPAPEIGWLPGRANARATSHRCRAVGCRCGGYLFSGRMQSNPGTPSVELCECGHLVVDHLGKN